ncbi:MAG: S-adenosylmethionine:tRNA ribosyltransferase-isomerase [Bacteriovoracaceae bacterium]|jgi:S-adenosylmethionine:tRNA ribosyltransferase-isomerase
MENNSLNNNIDLLAESYNYELDASFIADRPVAGRHNSKLLVYKVATNEIIHSNFKNLSEFLNAEHLLVLNQSKVFPCRLLGEKSSGGKVEVFLLSLIDNSGIYPAMIRANGKKRIGDEYRFGELIAKIVDRSDEGDFLISFNKDANQLLEYLEKLAQIPIPPYIRDGKADEQDLVDYQTVYAAELGSVAAPTAGLHFTDELFKNLLDKGIDKSFVTLHVGAGTFKPVSATDLSEHKMHSEFYNIDLENLAKINSGKKRIAVGTTSLRTLESTYIDGKIQLPEGDGPHSTDIFLHPGKEINSIDGLITNFHLPKSTLLMLVSTLIGREKALEIYEIAKLNDYRFFSYGDSMLILR